MNHNKRDLYNMKKDITYINQRFKGIHLLFLCLILGYSITTKAQQKLTFKDKLMYTDIRMTSDKNIFSIQSLIDTGCSLCVIDSTFAVDSCGVEHDKLKEAFVNTTRKKVSSIMIDSISLCGRTYREVHCLVIDLMGIYQEYAPNFIIGANILKSGAWKFDMEKRILKPCNSERKATGIVLKWKNHNDYQDVAMDYIIFEGKINAKKTRFAFDTGSKNNKLQRNLYTGETEKVQKDVANMEHKLSVKTVDVGKNIEFSIGKRVFTQNFEIGDYHVGMLNIGFLQGHSFILDYKKQILEIL